MQRLVDGFRITNECLGDKIKKHTVLTFEFIPQFDNTDEVIMCIGDGFKSRMVRLRDDEVLSSIKLLQLCGERIRNGSDE